jgi:glycerate-2-kinase
LGNPIRNRTELARIHGRPSGLVLSALEHGLHSVDPQVLIRRAVRFGDELTILDINGKKTSVSGFENAYLVGAGKATARMADALCTILGRVIAGGSISVPYGDASRVSKKNRSLIAVTEASHPIPDNSGLQGTERIIRVLKEARKNDLVFVLLSGGGSSLMPFPAPGLRLVDKQNITNKLLRSGADIREINVVRKHLSSIKGGQMLRYLGSSCRVISLILSDVIDDDLSIIASGPTYPDSSTFSDAVSVVRKYGVAKASDPCVDFLVRGSGGRFPDTPKFGDPLFRNVENLLIGTNSVACKSVVSFLQRKGLRAVYLGSLFDGEARDLGIFLGRLASHMADSALPPVAMVLGGETTVKLGRKKEGRGGRNQEAALSCAMAMKGVPAVAAFMGTDGIDGNSDAAGAIVSQKTARIAKSKRVNLDAHLAGHDSYNALRKLRSLIVTGRTGTNVNDIAIVYKYAST